MIHIGNNKYIEVKDYEGAVEQDEVKCEWFSCLIMDDHKIHIGEKEFWDWDDFMIK